MIIWINGPFGVGKTTTSDILSKSLGSGRVFDPEHVGYMLAGNLKDIEFSDFQDLPPWRALVPSVLAAVADFTSADIVAPQTVLRREYWDDLRSGMESKDLQVVHVVLDCDEDALRSRIIDDEADTDARQWRLDHVAEYAKSRSWMQESADLFVDTVDRSPDQVAAAIAEAASTESS